MRPVLSRRTSLFAALLLPLLAVAPVKAAEPAVIIPPPQTDLAPVDGTQTLVLAGGCFWGVQAVYQHTDGVVSAVSGYAGDTKEKANYDLVSHGGKTNHAEAVEIKYDPKKITYGKLLQIFFSVVHNPTQLNFQGPDTGTQYRSAIFYQSDEQKKVAEAYIAQLDAAKLYPKKIVTKLEPLLRGFFPAEDYHQDYATLNPMQPYIYINDAPKVANLKKVFSDIYREKPVLVRQASN
jgi:peptide-methionine (S)-S-oxide reductase